jgi:hypothetical protein
MEQNSFEHVLVIADNELRVTLNNRFFKDGMKL